MKIGVRPRKPVLRKASTARPLSNCRGLQFKRVVGVQHGDPRLRPGFHQPYETRPKGVANSRRLTIVNRIAEMLIFNESSGEFACDRVQLESKPEGKGLAPDAKDGSSPRVEPQFCPMNARRAKLQGEKSRSSSAIGRPLTSASAPRSSSPRGHAVHKAGRNRYVLGTLGEVEQRPIDIEKQGRSGRRSRTRTRATSAPALNDANVVRNPPLQSCRGRRLTDASRR